MKILLLLMGLLPAFLATAQDRPVEEFGENRVYYSAFRATFLEPEVAAAYNITRARDLGVINISVLSGDNPYSVKAGVTGTASNLMNQQQGLDFQTIKEREAAYYIGTFEIDESKAMTFDIQVKMPDQEEVYEFDFQRRFHDEET